jgi:hypothetical protein
VTYAAGRSGNIGQEIDIFPDGRIRPRENLASVVSKSVDVNYTKQFFDLQLVFASSIALLSKMPLRCALLNYTNLYARFGLGREFDATHPIWQEYLDVLERSTDHRDWTYGFYQARLPDVGPPSVVSTVGCFSYARLGADYIRLHFQNAEVAGHSPPCSAPP